MPRRFLLLAAASHLGWGTNGGSSVVAMPTNATEGEAHVATIAELPSYKTTNSSSMPAACARWTSVMPPTEDLLASQKWVVHRAETVYGLGDYLAGLLSAFLVAVSTRRRFYVDHPFGENLVSFAPYNKKPPLQAWEQQRSFHVELNHCPEWRALMDALNDEHSRVLVYEGADMRKGVVLPPNRACIWSWRHNMTYLWRALSGDNRWEPTEESSFEAFLTRSHVVYGCVLQKIFHPDPMHVVSSIPAMREASPVIGVHLRSSDAKFDQTKCPPPSPDLQGQAREIVEFRDTLGTHRRVGYRIESDDVCARSYVADFVSERRPDDVVAQPIAPPAHDILQADIGKQLAAWFALSAADVFVVSPMYAAMSREPKYNQYAHCPPKFFATLAKTSPGFADHSLLRLSSWSVMAALRAGADRVHVLCNKAPPSGWDKLRALDPAVLDDVPPYACDVTIPSTIALMSDAHLGPKARFKYVNVHFLRPSRLTDAAQQPALLNWGIGNFV